MIKDLIPNEKQYISRIEKAEKRLEKSSKTLLDDCVFLGKELIEIKKYIGFGGWGAFLNRNSHFRFATTRMASNYIRIAENSVYAKHYLTDETSINGIIQVIAEATPEQTEEAKSAEEQKQAEAKVERERKLTELASRNVEPEILEGEFVEIVKEVPVYDPVTDKDTEEYITQEQELDNIVEEVFSVNAKLQKENDYLVKVMGADDKLAAALEEIRILKILNASLESSIDQKMNTIAAQTRQIQNLEKRIKKFLEVNNG